MNERIDDDGLLEGQTPVPGHTEPSLPHRLSVTSSVPGPSQSIILSTASSSLHPLSPIRSGQQLIFLVRLNQHGRHQFRLFSLLTPHPHTHTPEELAELYLVFCFLYSRFVVLIFLFLIELIKNARR